jgi:hypothetical protein
VCYSVQHLSHFYCVYITLTYSYLFYSWLTPLVLVINYPLSGKCHRHYHRRRRRIFKQWFVQLHPVVLVLLLLILLVEQIAKIIVVAVVLRYLLVIPQARVALVSIQVIAVISLKYNGGPAPLIFRLQADSSAMLIHSASTNRPPICRYHL